MPRDPAAPSVGAPATAPPISCSPLAPFRDCPLCDRPLQAEHAHQRCPGCGWRDSCCD